MKIFASKTMKQMKKVNMKSLLQNRFVLYIIAFLAIIDILYLANGKDFNSVIVFVIVGFLTSFFSKNMIVVLLVAIIATHAIKYANGMLRKEGMEDKKDKKEGMKGKKEGMEGDDDADADADADSDASPDAIEEDLEEVKEVDTQDKVKAKQETYDKLKDDFTEFQGLQENILGNMKEIEPLLNKAEQFIEKFEGYKKNGKY